MFKRRFSRRRLPSRTRSRFARKKTQWAVGLNTECNFQVMEPGDDCPNGANIALLTNQQVRADFEDALIVRRVLGDLYFQVLPNADPAGGIIGILNAFAAQTYMRIGLKRSEVSQTLAGFPVAVNPMRTGVTAEDLGDFEDGKWIKQWEHLFSGNVSTADMNFPRPKVWKPLIVDCAGGIPDCVQPNAIASGGGYTWTHAIGGTNGGIKLDGECVDCDPDGIQANQGSFYAQAANIWHLHIDYKKPIRLKDNNCLDFWIGWETLNISGPSRQRQQPLVMAGGIRMLIEK